ncbi:hypothetical protein ACERK3_11575 [Phycisphaerales bacterium AB-hyl4]|uniref:Uncharacterized protein n=1 Tax=Natronomicrosphaera hydrolytica TaxID=3242702 RepID=A0ABV4U9H9_9BACT
MQVIVTAIILVLVILLLLMLIRCDVDRAVEQERDATAAMPIEVQLPEHPPEQTPEDSPAPPGATPS